MDHLYLQHTVVNGDCLKQLGISGIVAHGSIHPIVVQPREDRMQTTVHTKLSQVATRISEAAQQQVQRILAEQAAEQRRFKAKEAAESRREKAEKASIEAGIAKRLPGARKGLLALMDLGRSVEIQKILSALRNPYTPASITFYDVARITGWYWDASDEEIKKVEADGGLLVAEDDGEGCTFSSYRSPYDEEHLSVELEGEAIVFSSGAAVSSSGGISYTVYYTPQEGEREYQVEVEGTRAVRGEPVLLSLEEFLQRIAQPKGVNMGAIAHLEQHSHYWSPEEVFFQLLVSCGRRQAIERYLSKCLASLEKKQRKKK